VLLFSQSLFSGVRRFLFYGARLYGDAVGSVLYACTWRLCVSYTCHHSMPLLHRGAVPSFVIPSLAGSLEVFCILWLPHIHAFYDLPPSVLEFVLTPGLCSMYFLLH
jgi:hypothetical protein